MRRRGGGAMVESGRQSRREGPSRGEVQRREAAERVIYDGQARVDEMEGRGEAMVGWEVAGGKSEKRGRVKEGWDGLADFPPPTVTRNRKKNGELGKREKREGERKKKIRREENCDQ